MKRLLRCGRGGLPLMMLVALCCRAGELRPFSSDGCSAFPDGTFVEDTLWLKCCTAHDYAYWKGGTYQQRQAADTALKACVAQVGEPGIALLMLVGVRIGGTALLPTAFRWGYGWPYPRMYGELSEAEQAMVERMSGFCLGKDTEACF